MHNWAVHVALEVGLKTVESFTPGYLANLIRGNAPFTEAREMTAEALGHAWGCEVDESVSQTQPPSEINRKVKKVKASHVTLRIQELQQHVSSVTVGQVAHHD